MHEDPIVTEVRRTKETLAGKFNYDVHAIFDDMRREQGRYADRLINLEQTSSSQTPVSTQMEASLPDRPEVYPTTEKC